MNSPKALGNPLAAFRDALYALAPDQAEIAAFDMRQWLRAREQGQSAPVATPLQRDEGVVGSAGATPSPPKLVNRSISAPGAESEGEDSSPRISSPSLEAFSQTLRDYQEGVVEDAATFLESCWGPSPPERMKTLYTFPCGTGKGTAELALLKGLREQEVDAWIYTPSLEVIRGFIERCGGSIAGAGDEKIAAMGEAIFVTTPIRARNRIEEGVRGTAEVVIYDEVHHAISTNDVAGTLFAVAPDAIWFGFTATPFRASPKATGRLLEDWGEPVDVMNIPDAIEEGYMALPSFRVVPLVDDDIVKVVAGKFQAKATTKAYGSRIEDLAKLIADCVETDPEDAQDCGCSVDPWVSPHPISVHTPVTPTAITVPSSDVANMLVDALDRHGVRALWIHAKSSAKERTAAYAECKAGSAVLVSIKVVSEGWDAPWLDRLIDARPTISPVAWLQLIGRIMRPGRAKEYICTNRNLERHAYLMQGAIPRRDFVEAQEAFEMPSKRSGMRQIGLEALKRFKAIPIPLDGGGFGAMYCVHSVAESGVKTEYVTILDPTAGDPLVACRNIQPLMPGEKRRGAGAYGKFAVCAMPLDFTGYATTSATGPFSDKQRECWKRDARKYGLSDRNMEALTKRQFQALGVFWNTKRDIRGNRA